VEQKQIIHHAQSQLVEQKQINQQFQQNFTIQIQALQNELTLILCFPMFQNPEN
jgi:hypothetical protein